MPPIPPAPLPEEQLLAELEHGRQDERNERDERRGLEARASALLAAGVAVIGLVANALRDINVQGAERDALLGLAAGASLAMAIAIALLARALTRRKVAGGHVYSTTQPSHLPQDVIAQGELVNKIRKKNNKMLDRLKPATWVFAGSVAGFIAVLIWAAFASKPSAPPPRPIINVVVQSPPGPHGAQGPRGPRGPQGRGCVSGVAGAGDPC
jgi:hypothetical protein